MVESGQEALNQLSLIKQCLENFKKLSDKIKEDSKITQEIQRRKENSEIV